MKNDGTTVRHAMYLYYDYFGRIRIMDRTGVYTKLSDIGPIYGAKEIILQEAVRVEGVYAKIVGPKGLTILVMEVLGVVATEKK